MFIIRLVLLVSMVGSCPSSDAEFICSQVRSHGYTKCDIVTLYDPGCDRMEVPSALVLTDDAHGESVLVGVCCSDGCTITDR